MVKLMIYLFYIFGYAKSIGIIVCKFEGPLGCVAMYNFEFSFGGSPHPYAPLVKRHKQNLEKSVFRDTLLSNLQSAGVGGGDNVKNAPS